uniref:TRIM8/14/16/25/29/45/65 coiled-coil region domain-containing protein n=1 Tax=Hucho hucho TaxID=62062 RepID=A0A4W5JNG7_9TELE
MCTMDEHKGHDTGSAAAERMKKQNHQKFNQIIQERAEEIQELRQAVDYLKHSPQAAVEDSERIFSELREGALR